VVVTFEVSGNSIDPMTFRVRRRVEALDDSPNPELSYAAEVIDEGATARAARFASAADRVLGPLRHGEGAALTVQQIGDRLAHDGIPLKAATIRQALNRDLRERVDSLEQPGGSTLWWRV
jgi:hypothetical protein